MVLRCMRSEFSLPEGAHYLDCAYMSPMHRGVESTGVAGIARKRVPSEIGPAAFFDESSRLRAAFSDLVGGRGGEHVALVPAVSYGMASIAANLRLSGRDNIVVAEAQFPSNVYAWRRACADAGATLRTVASPGPVGALGRGARWNAAILEAIDGDTAVVALDAVHWTDGTWFDLDAIAARAHECDALFVVDGTQSVGAQPIDVVATGIDALVCAGYKWLLGPYSTAFAYLGDRFAGGRPLEETWIGRAGSEDFRRLVEYRDEYQPGVTRFDVGERSNFVLHPMSLAAIELLRRWGVAEIQAYCGRLCDRVANGARALGYAVEERPWRAAHLVGLGVPARVPPDRLTAALTAHGVRVSLRGDAVRVSPHVYDDDADVDALLAALTVAARA